MAGQAPVSPGLAALFDRMAGVAAAKPGPEPAMAAKDREILALLETASPGGGDGWLSEVTLLLSSDPGAAEQAYEVYARLDELAALPVDDSRVEETARALVAAIPETAGLPRARQPASRSDETPPVCCSRVRRPAGTSASDPRARHRV